VGLEVWSKSKNHADLLPISVNVRTDDPTQTHLGSVLLLAGGSMSYSRTK